MQNKQKDIKDYPAEIIERLLKSIPIDARKEYENKIIFAICINETECWLLPIYYTYTDKDRCKTTGCISKLNIQLNKKGERFIPEKDKNSPNAQNTYKSILKKLKKKQDVKDCSENNYGFDCFIKQLDSLIFQNNTTKTEVEV